MHTAGTHLLARLRNHLEGAPRLSEEELTRLCHVAGFCEAVHRNGVFSRCRKLLAVLTTNLRSDLDEAFISRLDVIVDFPMPEPSLRRDLWDRCLGPSIPRADGLDLDFRAHFELAGGSIRACVITAAYRSAESGRPFRATWSGRSARSTASSAAWCSTASSPTATPVSAVAVTNEAPGQCG